MWNLSTSKRFGAVTAAAMVLAVALCALLYAYAQVNDIQTSGIVMQYETELFSRDVITLEIEADPDDWQEMLDNATQEQYISCNVTINGTKFENVGIRPKGNSSLTSVASSDSDRYSFRIKFDEYVDGQTCFGLDQFVVNNIQSDTTYMKEYLSYELMNFAGVTTPLYTYADISVNGEAWGFYLAIESYRESFLERSYGSLSGNLYNVKMTGGGNRGQENGQDEGMENPPELPSEGEQSPLGNEGDSASQKTAPSVEKTAVQGGGSTTSGRDAESTSPGDGPPAIPDGEQPSGERPARSGENETTSSGGDTTANGEPTQPPSAEAPSENGEITGADGDGTTQANGRGSRGEMGGGFGGGGMGASNGGSLQYTDDSIDSYAAIFENAVLSKTTDEDKQRVITALQKLSEGEELEQYFDVDQIIRYFAVHTVVVNLDSYVSSMQQNYYLYENNGVVSILPWDYNLAFGGFQSGNASSVINFPIDTPVSGISVEDRPLLAMVLENEAYAARYHSCLQQIVEEYYGSGLFEANVEKLRERIASYVENDPSAFYTYEEFEEGVSQLIELCLLRAESIQGQLNGAIPSTTEGQKEDGGSLVSAASVSLSALGSQGGGGGGFDRPDGDSVPANGRPSGFAQPQAQQSANLETIAIVAACFLLLAVAVLFAKCYRKTYR